MTANKGLAALLSVYTKMFPWSFRDRHGAPLLGTLMGLMDNKVVFDDYAVFLNPQDKTASELFLIHAAAGGWIWESYEIGLFLSSLQANPGCVAVDLGANYGAYTLSCCKPAVRSGLAGIVAVEPNRRTFECLKRSVDYNGFSQYVNLANAAISAVHNSECEFHPHEKYSAMSKASAKSQDAKLDGHGSPYRVRGVTLDGLLGELNISKNNSFVIKIDIEGSEPIAFKGMEETLRSASGFQVYFELHPEALKSLGHDPAEFARYLFDLGPDLVAEVDQHDKVSKRISSVGDFEKLVHSCLTTTEMWKDYTNMFISRGLKVPSAQGLP